MMGKFRIISDGHSVLKGESGMLYVTNMTPADYK